MADPIRLPNSTPKDFSTTKVTRTARQKFENRQKRQQQKPDMRRKSKTKKSRSPLGPNETDVSSNSVGKERDPKSGSKDTSAAGRPDQGQGNVIDVRI